MNDFPIYTMCEYCHSVEGGHTMACQAIHSDSKPAQVRIPDDAPWLKRRRAEWEQATAGYRAALLGDSNGK